MQKRTLKVALLAVLATVLVFGISGVALADQTWKDLPDTVTAKYGITDNQVAGISEGYSNGYWRPFSYVTRAQFTKMAVAAFNIPLSDSAIASYTDVPKSSFYYPYIEGAKAAGVVLGTTATTFSPNVRITRQQAIAIVARYIAKAQGYDLATMYTSQEITDLLAHFGDAASISSDLRDEMAFAYDVGITNGDDYGNLKPLANLTRIQGAALLIRAQSLVPPNLWVPAAIELVSTDKTEGLIGQTFEATFKVTTADGHPAKNVLVDFDSLSGAEFYVGNVSSQAGITDDFGQVTVELLSMEPGTQRVTARVTGVGTAITTRYWLVLDEVYTVDDSDRQAINNAGVQHVWGVRVVVFGPGPRSTSQGDWYNAIDADFDPTDIDEEDGVDVICELNGIIDDGWSYADELALAKVKSYWPYVPLTPRTMAGIDVEWTIYNPVDNPTTFANEAYTSVGNIVAVDGTAITPAKTAVGKTDSAGYSYVTILSEQTGKTYTYAIADYPENPYPEQLFTHWTFQDYQDHYSDWLDQPTDEACQLKTWIAHTIGGGEGPISAAYTTANIGEELILTITLVDVYGNPVAGKQVEWFMQGVGFFQTDDAGDTSDPDNAANNKDFDVTDALGKAKLFVKSYDAGEQIIHAKVRDKGTGGAEGTYVTYTAEVQWFDVDIVTFDDITTIEVDIPESTGVEAHVDYMNEAVSTNAVNGEHEFCVHVYGLKLEYDPSIEYADGQTPLIDSDAAGDSYDGKIDYKDAEYYGGLLMWCMPQQGEPEDYGWSWWEDKLIAPWGYDMRVKIPGTSTYDYTPGELYWLEALPWDSNHDGIIDYEEVGTIEFKVAGVWLTLSFEGAYTMYDFDDDAYKESFTGVPGIYLPLAGKKVTFIKANETGADFSNLNLYGDPLIGIPYDFAGLSVDAVGTYTPTTAVTTDASGMACVTVTSTLKGPETIKATVDWPGNPHNGPELVSAYAKKNWVSGSAAAANDVTIEVLIDGEKVADSKVGEIAEAVNPMWIREYVEEGPRQGEWISVLNSAHVEVHVKDAYGNDLADYEVVYLLENIDEWLGGSQNAVDTRIPFAYLVDIDTVDDFDGEPLEDNPGEDYPNYDTNGSRPDSNEPTPASDPYAAIVGPGWNPELVGEPGYDLDLHEAFFFNQWLGSDNGTHKDFLTLAKGTDHGQAGVPDWFTRVPSWEFDDYCAFFEAVYIAYAPTEWQFGSADAMFDGFDGIYDGSYYPEYLDGEEPCLGLATDGAKAWTLDGYYIPYERGEGWDEDGVQPNLLTGSHIDIQLAEGNALDADHYKSILRVMVYAPADGIVQEGSYIWSTQVHKVWEAPVPTTVVLAPASTYAVANGDEAVTLVATVLDQFGNPMPDEEVLFNSEDLDLDATLRPTTNLTLLTDDPGSSPTDANGNATINLTQATGTWGVESVVATADVNQNGSVDIDEPESAAAIIQWVFDDSGTSNLTAVAATNQVTVSATLTPTDLGWDGRLLTVYANPGGTPWSNPYGYVAGTLTAISTTRPSWVSGDGYYVGANSTDTDGRLNYMHNIVP